MNVATGARVLQEAFDGDGVSEADLLQFFDGAHRRRYCQYIAPRLHQSAPQLAESRGLASTGCAADAHRTVARLKHELHGVLLLRAQTVGDEKRAGAAERFECAESAVDGGNHVSFALQSLRRCDLAARTQDLARGFLQMQFALQVGKPDSSPAMP